MSGLAQPVAFNNTSSPHHMHAKTTPGEGDTYSDMLLSTYNVSQIKLSPLYIATIFLLVADEIEE